MQGLVFFFLACSFIGDMVGSDLVPHQLCHKVTVYKCFGSKVNKISGMLFGLLEGLSSYNGHILKVENVLCSYIIDFWIHKAAIYFFTLNIA